MTAPFHLERLLFTPTSPSGHAAGVVFAFPNEYSVGITSLGYQIIWAILAQREDLAVARLFTDGSEPLPNPIELLGFSMSWELDYANILTMLTSLDIPILAADRDNEHPLVFGGGPVLTANPEPFAAFFDVVLLGDGEVVLGAFIDAYQTVRDCDRATQLRHLAQVPGVYIPQLYEPTYESLTGPLTGVQPIDADIPAVIEKQTYRGNALSTSSVVTEKAAWENIYMVEVVRSCPEMCRFCLASYLTLPFRAAPMATGLVPAVEKGIVVTNRLGLLGASVTQHPEFDDLLDYLNQAQFDDVRVSMASVRTNTVNQKLTETLTRHGTKSITIAIESGSEQVRRIVNKKLDTADIVAAAINAKAGGMSALKLYGMVGIPGESLADVETTAELMLQLKKAAPGLRLTLGCSTFVPKAHTPFQWCGVAPQADKRLKLLQKRLRSQGIDFRPESYNWSIIQAMISRGDRRLTPLLLQTREFGDSLGSYKRAFKSLKGQLPNLDFYVYEQWGRAQFLPWGHLQGPLPKPTLLKHWDTAIAQATPGNPTPALA
ncbi:MAG: B12-binding domain-containing radical SAM protein [Leptolyngbyaceae cyanobacterium]